jgi:hypothetical protein
MAGSHTLVAVMSTLTTGIALLGWLLVPRAYRHARRQG